MDKLVQIPKYFADTFEPSVQIIDADYWTSNVKTASEAFDFIKNVKPKPGHRFILVIAMGAGEWWGANKNGDFFPEQDLLKNYQHFETKYNEQGQVNGGALVFKHHKNKLAENHPWFGTVVKSFYNTKMHRVELLLDIHGSKGQDIIDRVNKGEDIAVSMGVRIPYDICCICRNKAKTREYYCDHLKYELGKFLPDGRKVYAINGDYDYSVHPKPLNFFDISIVFRPADMTGYMLKKVAEEMEETVGSAYLAEKQASMQDKVAYLKKLSKMDKVIKGIPVAEKDGDGSLRMLKAYKPSLDRAISDMPSMSNEHIEGLSKYPMNKVLSTLSKAGIILTTPEFVDLVVFKLTGEHVPRSILADIVANQSEIFDKMAEDEDTIEEYSNFPMFQDVPADFSILREIDDIRGARDLSSLGITKRASHTDFTRSVAQLNDMQFPWGDRKGMLDTHTITDPKTGKKLTTTLGAIEDARVWSRSGHVAKAALASAGLGGLYLYLKSVKSPITPIAGLAAILLGGKYILDAIEKEDHGYGHSDQGEALPRGVSAMEKKSSMEGWDEFGKYKLKVGIPPWRKMSLRERLNSSMRKGIWHSRVAATALPVLGTMALHKYYQDKGRKGTLGMYSDELDKKLERGGRWAYTHPVLTAGTGVVGAHLGLNTLDALRKAVLRK